MPDLHHSFNEHSIEHKTVDQLSIQELEQIAARADENDDSVIEHKEVNKQEIDSGEEKS